MALTSAAARPLSSTRGPVAPSPGANEAAPLVLSQGQPVTMCTSGQCTNWLVQSNCPSRTGESMTDAKTKTGRADRQAAAQPGPRRDPPEHHRDRIGGVRAQRPVGRADRRDRGADAVEQADDLLLLRRQGGAVPRRARERVPAGPRRRVQSSTSKGCRRSMRYGSSSSSPSIIITSMRISSAW